MNKLKHIYYFLRWWYSTQTDKLLFWFIVNFWCIIIGGFLVNLLHSKIGLILFALGIIGILSIIFLIWIIDPIKNAYRKFKQEQNRLLKDLKD